LTQREGTRAFGIRRDALSVENTIESKSTLHAWLVGLVFGLLAVAYVVVGARRWLPPLASEHGSGIDLMMNYLMISTGALFLAGHLILGYFIVRFARGKGGLFLPPSAKAQRMWSIIPAVVIALVAEGGVIAIGLPVWAKFYGQSAPQDSVVVEVTAEQFTWNIRYPRVHRGAYDYGAAESPMDFSSQVAERGGPER
jgi:heme/copper-type cytochrome/quinol oxidase subunit 2